MHQKNTILSTLRKHIEKYAIEDTVARERVYQNAIKQAQKLPPQNAQYILECLNLAIQEIEREIKFARSQSRDFSPFPDNDTEAPKDGVQNTHSFVNAGEKKPPRTTSNRASLHRRFAKPKLAALFAVCLGILMIWLTQQSSIKTASNTASTPVSSPSDQKLTYKFPEDLDLFNEYIDPKDTGGKFDSSSRDYLELSGKTRLFMKDFIPINPSKRYLITIEATVFPEAKFNKDKLLVFIGFDNFGKDDKHLKKKHVTHFKIENIADINNQARNKGNSNSFYVLIDPAQSKSSLKFNPDASKYKLILSVFANRPDIRFRLKSINLTPL